MRAVASISWLERLWIVPTLTWISVSDTALRLLCGCGMVLSMILIAGLPPIVVVRLLWLFYRSLSVVGQDFLSYQWYALLLETGLHSIFLPPVTQRDCASAVTNPPRVMVWL